MTENDYIITHFDKLFASKSFLAHSKKNNLTEY